MISYPILKAAALLLSFTTLLVLLGALHAYSSHLPPFYRKFKSIDPALPDVDIKGAFYINMDSSVTRRNSFLALYDGPQPLLRIPGVVAQRSNGPYLPVGDYGCLLAHANVLEIIAASAPGWYAVFEDDAIGPFDIGRNVFLRNIVHRSRKQFVNLSGGQTQADYSLSEVHGLTHAYVVHSAYAKELATLVRGSKIPVDLTYNFQLQEARFPLYMGNGKGAFVNLVERSLGSSDRVALNESAKRSH